MPQIRKTAQAIYLQMAKICSQDSYHSLYAGLLIQSTSFLHSLIIPFILTFPLESLGRYKILPIIHDIIRLLAIFPYFNVFSSYAITLAVWWIIVAYFVAYVAAFTYIVFRFSNDKVLSSKAAKYITNALIIHSRVLFFPLNYFLLEAISKFTRCSSSEIISPVFNTGFLTVNIILVSWNIVLAFCKEIFFYQIVKTKSSFSCTNNHVSKLLLFQKIISVFLFVLFKETKASNIMIAFINFISYSSLNSVLYFKLPFYKMQMTQVSMIFSGFALFLSALCIFKVFEVFEDSPALEYILYFGSTFIVKILLQFLQELKNRILRFEFYSPEQAVHLPILLNEAIILSYPFPMMHKKFNPKLLSYCTLLGSHGIDLSTFQNDHESFKQNETQIYLMIIEKLNIVLNKYPKSEVLRLCMAHIYLNKFKNAAKSINLIRSISSFSHSQPIKNSVNFALNNLEQIYSLAYKEDNQYLDTLKYFEYRDLANIIKTLIQSENSKHLEFWKVLRSEKVDALNMILLAEEVNNSHLKIKKTWSQYTESISATFGAPVLLYGIYLEAARDLPNEAYSLISAYFEPKKKKNIDQENMIESICFESAAIIVGSIESDRLGKIIDASATVKNVFRIAKEQLLDQKIDILMPNVIAKKHDEFINKYNRSPSFKLNTELNSIAKTVDGHFFSVKISLKICPLITNGVCVMNFVKKCSENEPTFIVGSNDNILECSKEMEQLFRFDKSFLNFIKVQQVFPELTQAIAAFNLLYRSPEKPPEKSKEENSAKKMSLIVSGNNHLKVENAFLSMDYSDTDIHESRHIMGRVENFERILTRRKASFLITETQQSSTRNLFTPKQTQDLAKTHQIRDKESAIEICKRYKEGIRMTLTSLDPTSTPKKQAPKQFIIRIEPLFMDGAFYKIIKLNQYEDTPQTIDEYKIYKKGEYSDRFSIASERALINSTMRERCKDKEVKSIEVDEKNLFQVKIHEINMKTAQVTDNARSMSSVTQSKLVRVNQFVKEKPNEANSVKDNSRLESRVMMKTLNNILMNENVKLTTRFSIAAVYFVILTIVILAAIDYIYTGSSIDDSRDGVLITDTANKRLYHNVILLQYIIGLYSSVISSSKTSMNFLQTSLYQTTLNMIEQNDILKIKLQETDNMDIKRTFFVKRVALWEPSTRTIFNSEKIDSFTASHVLGTKI